MELTEGKFEELLKLISEMEGEADSCQRSVIAREIEELLGVVLPE